MVCREKSGSIKLETLKISLENISKSYGETLAVKDINIEVESGELFGLIGPDGAGKTTLFRILTTLLLPDTGEALIGTWDTVKDYKEIRNSVGYMPGKFSLYQDLTITENLEFFATIFGTTFEENYELIKDIYDQIAPFKDRRAGKLSGGMKQKLALCCAMIHEPKVLLLDEPTTGVDPVSRKEFWEILKRIQERKITILVSTPYMDEASLCDRIAMIQNGEILEINNPLTIAENFDKSIYKVKANNAYRLLLALKNFPDTHSVFPFGEYVHYISENEKFNKSELEAYLKSQGLEQIEIELTQASIEDVFMELSK